MKTIFEPTYRDMVATLRAARLQKGLRQEDVAIRMGITRTWIAKVEICEIRLDVIQLVRLARVYGLRAHRLVKEVEGALLE
jgi:transcriptional regulator with XRE-family HTH domain